MCLNILVNICVCLMMAATKVGFIVVTVLVSLCTAAWCCGGYFLYQSFDNKRVKRSSRKAVMIYTCCIVGGHILLTLMCLALFKAYKNECGMCCVAFFCLLFFLGTAIAVIYFSTFLKEIFEATKKGIRNKVLLEALELTVTFYTYIAYINAVFLFAPVWASICHIFLYKGGVFNDDPPPPPPEQKQEEEPQPEQHHQVQVQAQSQAKFKSLVEKHNMV